MIFKTLTTIRRGGLLQRHRIGCKAFAAYISRRCLTHACERRQKTSDELFAQNSADQRAGAGRCLVGSSKRNRWLERQTVDFVSAVRTAEARRYLDRKQRTDTCRRVPGGLRAIGNSVTREQTLQLLEVTQTVGHTWIALFYLSLLFTVLADTGGLIARVGRIGWLQEWGGSSDCVSIIHATVKCFCFGFLTRNTILLTSWRSGAAGLLSIAISHGVAKLSWTCFEQPLLQIGHRYKYQRAQTPSEGRDLMKRDKGPEFVLALHFAEVAHWPTASWRGSRLRRFTSSASLRATSNWFPVDRADLSQPFFVRRRLISRSLLKPTANRKVRQVINCCRVRIRLGYAKMSRNVLIVFYTLGTDFMTYVFFQWRTYGAHRDAF
jgi:hypothetical protein